MNWNECCQEVGYNENMKAPARIYAYYAYRTGKVYPCESYEIARNISHMIEKVCQNDALVKDFWDGQHRLRNEAIKLFKVNLKGEYDLTNEQQFEAIFNKVSESNPNYSQCTFLDAFDDLFNWLNDNNFLQ